jgi:hypothetical protein
VSNQVSYNIIVSSCTYERSLYIDPPVPLKAQPIAVPTAQSAVCCVIYLQYNQFLRVLSRNVFPPMLASKRFLSTAVLCNRLCIFVCAIYCDILPGNGSINMLTCTNPAPFFLSLALHFPSTRENSEEGEAEQPFLVLLLRSHAP